MTADIQTALDRAREAPIVHAWESRRFAQPLALSDGSRVAIVYPGRRVGGPGPDFRDAILAFPDGQIIRGDVEVHLRAADWTAHGHHDDPAYNRVVLHVVGDGPAIPVPRQDGAAIPTVLLTPTDAPPTPPAIVCPPSDRAAAARALDEAGDRWWRDRLTRVAAAIDASDAESAAWTLLLDAAGFGGNQAGFAALAEALPWTHLDGLLSVRDPVVRRQRAIAVLLGAAGLTDDPDLLARWRQLGAPRPWRPIVWNRVGLRPANAPDRRARAVAILAANAAPLGWRDWTARLLLGARAATAVAARLRQASESSVSAAFALTIIVHVTLPYAVTTGVIPDQEATAWFRQSPRLPENQTDRHMARLLFDDEAPRHVTSARRQQGLLYVFRRWCQEKRCERCLVGRATRGEPPDEPDDPGGIVAIQCGHGPPAP